MTDTSKEAAAKWALDLRCRAFAYKTDIDIAKHIESISAELEATKAQLATARDAALEEAACMADNYFKPVELPTNGTAILMATADTLSVRIRALKSSPARGDTQDEKRRKVIEVGTALLADVRARYPGERLKCQYMLNLAAALGELKGMAQGEKP